jgi:hypothetical protein
LYVALFAAFAVAAIGAPASQGIVPIFISAMTGSAIAIFWVWSYSDGKTDDDSLRSLIIIGVVVDLLFNFVATKVDGAAAIKVLSSALTGIGNLGVLTAAIGVGLLVGRGLQKPNYLVMAAIVGALTDIFSVYAGPSKHIIGSGAFPYVSFQWGVIGQGGVQPIVGAGDFIFLALYFFGVRKFGLDDRKTLYAMIFAIAAGFVATLFVGAIPALPFMSIALLIAHGRELKQQMTPG